MLHGILNAAKDAKPGSVVLVLTNGLPKDSSEEAAVKKIAMDRGLRIIFAVTGCCGKPVCKGEKFQVMNRIAKSSKGVIYRIGLSDVQQVRYLFCYLFIYTYNCKKYVTHK